MAKVREIKTRIKAVANIRRITNTMKMIATARFQASQKRATAAKPYTQKIGELVGELATAAASGGGSFSHPLLKSPEPKVGRELLLVLTSNRGLCGAYNANILRMANGYLRSREGAGELEVVGKKGVAFFKFRKIEVARIHSQMGDQPQYEDVERLANEYMAAFTEGQYDAVKVCYMGFQSMSRQTPVMQQLLPLEDPTALAGEEKVAKTNSDYEFSPDAEALLGELLPATVRAQLFQCFNEAVVSEQIGRMIAMTAATENAGDMTKSLTRQYNRARQASITTELTEIIAGAAALE